MLPYITSMCWGKVLHLYISPLPYFPQQKTTKTVFNPNKSPNVFQTDHFYFIIEKLCNVNYFGTSTTASLSLHSHLQCFHLYRWSSISEGPGFLEWEWNNIINHLHFCYFCNNIKILTHIFPPPKYFFISIFPFILSDILQPILLNKLLHMTWF